MKRKEAILAYIFFLLASCSRRPPELSAILPENVAAWTREAVRSMSASDAPEVVRSAGMNRWATADYHLGSAQRIAVEIYAMKGETSAFELQQKFHESDTITFYKGPLFVVARRKAGEPADLQSFARSLQSQLILDR